MSTFYLLPPRPQLGRHFAAFLSTWFPGLRWPTQTWAELAETLGQAAAGQADVFVVHREDLPPDEDLSQALADGYGAEAGDEIIEITAAGASGQLTARRWRLAA
jgi:hypothetical protein